MAEAKRKTTYRLPSILRQEMLENVEKIYGKKGKSRWIGEAIALLVAQDVALSSVGLGEDHENQDAVDVVQLGSESYRLLELAMTKIRRQDPLFEGVQSAVIRAAIRIRLEAA